MALPFKPSPLGQRTAPSSRRTTSDPIIAKIRQHHKEKIAKKYGSQPWLKRLSMQTRQSDHVRRTFLKVQSGFYWQTLRDTVMSEEKRPINKYFLEPTAVTTSRAYTKIVKKSMNFKKMQRKWARGAYHADSYAIWSDFNLIVDNAVAYYPKGHRIHEAAKKLRNIYEEECEPRKWSEWMNNAVEIAHEEGLEI